MARTSKWTEEKLEAMEGADLLVAYLAARETAEQAKPHVDSEETHGIYEESQADLKALKGELNLRLQRPKRRGGVTSFT